MKSLFLGSLFLASIAGAQATDEVANFTGPCSGRVAYKMGDHVHTIYSAHLQADGSYAVTFLSMWNKKVTEIVRFENQETCD